MTGSAAPFGINSYGYIYTHAASDAFVRFAEMGYRHVEMMVYPGHLWPGDLAAGARSALRKQAEALGLAFTTLNMPNLDLNIASAIAEMRAHSLAQLEAAIALAGDLGAPAVVLGPGKPNPLFPQSPDQLMGWFRAGLDVLLPAARAAGVRLLAENMPFAFLPRADQLMAALAEYGSDEIGVVYDVANAVFAREDPGQGLALVRDRLALVHLSDTGLDAYRHDPVGRGTVDFEAFGRALADVGYAGPAMLEIISATPDADLPDSLARLQAMPAWQAFAGA